MGIKTGRKTGQKRRSRSRHRMVIPRNLQLPSSATDLTVTFESVLLLAIQLDQLERDIEKSEAFVARLFTWLQDFIENIHPGRPKKWTDKSLIGYYGKYKALQEKMSHKKKTFEEANKQAGQNPTPSQQPRLAQLAVEWCQAALGAADSRLFVLASFPAAYRTREKTKGHITAAQSLVRSARNALKKGRRFHNPIAKHISKTFDFL